MDTDRRRRLTPDERRSQLLALGVAFLADRPLDDLTIEELSARAGVSRGLVFHYFGSKQGLHRAVVTTAAESMLAASAPREELDPLDRLHDTLVRIVTFVRDYRGTFFSLVRGVASGDPVVRRVVDESRDAHAERVIAAFLDLGAADTPMLRVALRSWVSFVEEVLIETTEDDTVDVDEITRFLARSAQGVVAALAEPA